MLSESNDLPVIYVTLKFIILWLCNGEHEVHPKKQSRNFPKENAQMIPILDKLWNFKLKFSTQIYGWVAYTI